jgi:hypothetical protein
MSNAEILLYRTRTGRWRARVRNEHGTAYTSAYRSWRGVGIDIEQILDGVCISEGQPCLNPEASDAHDVNPETESKG